MTESNRIYQTAEGQRLQEDNKREKYWKHWGPYLSERQWGTVREDYSDNGAAWDYFSHDQSRSRAYRWGEDGIAGISDDHQRLCFAIALWNGVDTIIKERLFGLTNSEGNHGEDVKEYYFYLDNTPTHSYMECLYKYPQKAYPYNDLIQENARRKSNPYNFEYELINTGVFKDGYFDVNVKYAKNSPEDILIAITVSNRGNTTATLSLLPTLWLRNTWSWGYENQTKDNRNLKALKSDSNVSIIEAAYVEDAGSTSRQEKRWLYCEAAQELLFTENETNKKRFNWGENSGYVKDGINDYIVSRGQKKTVNPQQTGTKAAAHYQLTLAAGETKTVRLRLSNNSNLASAFADFNTIFDARRTEADEFYQAVCPFTLSQDKEVEKDMRRVQRQAFAGMLWSKQFYHYIVQDWLNGDPIGPKPSDKRKQRNARNTEWSHLFNEDILSMPDKWEYPWFAAWDLAFHTTSLAYIDPEFAKRQLSLLTWEWYMHPNGQIPAYEWNFGDVNPPVHAWAAWRVFEIKQKLYGTDNNDREFLERIFQKLNFYFTWWVNRKDEEGNNIFGGGFLGLDNIGVFDRSAKQLPTGGSIEQSDGTSWMGMYCLNMLKIALKLADEEPEIYQDIARKYLQHFLYITEAMNLVGGNAANLWDDNEGFFYDILHLPSDRQMDGKQSISMKVRSMVGLIPLFAIEKIDQPFQDTDSFFSFERQFQWFLDNRRDLTKHDNVNIDINMEKFKNKHLDATLTIVNKEKLKKILEKMLDENEFLSPYGIRSVSKFHEKNPYVLWVDGKQYRVDYAPAESRNGDFGGNSNWRGPIWFPVNFLIIESLQKFHSYLGDSFKIEYPAHSGKLLTLKEISMELTHRLITVFLRDSHGKRPVYGGDETFQSYEHWRDHILFYEYFHGDNGAGLGASHQTGWTGLVANLIYQWGEYLNPNSAGK